MARGKAQPTVQSLSANLIPPYPSHPSPDYISPFPEFSLSDISTTGAGSTAALGQLDPHLLSLAAHVQAHHAQYEAQAFAHAELGMLDTPDLPHLDPALFQIEQVVNDVRRGKIRLDQLDAPEVVQPTSTVPLEDGSQQVDLHEVDGLELPSHDVGLVVSGGHGHGHDAEAIDTEQQIQLDDEIDPTLREIVNSLTNAQQSSHAGPGLSHAQAAAAIGAHLTDAEERERLQQSLQTTLEDLTQSNFSSFFPAGFAQSPTQSYLDLNHDPDAIVDQATDVISHASAEAGPSTILLPDSASPATSSLHGALGEGEASLDGMKRGRGRPKGSKNKHKRERPPRPPKPPGPPKKPKGRPPKVRTGADQADYELRLQEKALGIKRQKGRPRKFPGYLVREMRLKKNRPEFKELLRAYEAQQRGQDGVLGHEEEQGGEGMEVDVDVDLDEGLELDEGIKGMMSELAMDHQHLFDPRPHPNITRQHQQAHGQLHPPDTIHDRNLHLDQHDTHQHQQEHEQPAPDLLDQLGHLANQQQHDHHDHGHEHGHQHEHDGQTDFSNWSVQDSQTLLEAVGVGVGVGVGMEGHHDRGMEEAAALLREHQMEDVFGLSR